MTGGRHPPMAARRFLLSADTARPSIAWHLLGAHAPNGPRAPGCSHSSSLLPPNEIAFAGARVLRRASDRRHTAQVRHSLSRRSIEASKCSPRTRAAPRGTPCGRGSRRSVRVSPTACEFGKDRMDLRSVLLTSQCAAV